MTSSKDSYKTTLSGGKHWSLVVRRGTLLKFTALADRANVGLIMFNSEDKLERLNLPDSLKCQHTLRLTKGNCLFSDMGRIFASIVEDDLGWHDSIGGNLLNKDMIEKKWQATTFQDLRNDRTQTGLDSFLIELTKWGLSKRDLPANLNLFSKVVSDAAGNLTFDPDHCKKGSSVTLRFEMDTLLILNTCPHPMDPATEYPFRGVEIEISRAASLTSNDACVNARPETARGFENNRLYYLGIDEQTDEYFSNAVLPEAVANKKSEAEDASFFARVQASKIVHSTLDPLNAISQHRIDAGDHYVGLVKKGQTIRIVDVEGNEAADTLFYNAHDVSERYSAMDTIRSQENVYLTTGTKLLSNLGNCLLQITADTCTRHDTIGGACASESNTVRYSLERRHMHSCRDNWMLACANHPEFGISKADIGHNINFFMNVPTTPEGELDFADGVSGPGKYVELRAEMDVIVLISNCPQLNNPCSGYAPTPLDLIIWN